MPDHAPPPDPEEESGLPPDGYAVLFVPERGFEVHLPKSMANTVAELPDAATALLACATRLANDPEFLAEQVKWMERQRDPISSPIAAPRHKL